MAAVCDLPPLVRPYRRGRISMTVANGPPPLVLKPVVIDGLPVDDFADMPPLADVQNDDDDGLPPLLPVNSIDNKTDNDKTVVGPKPKAWNDFVSSVKTAEHTAVQFVESVLRRRLRPSDPVWYRPADPVTTSMLFGADPAIIHRTDASPDSRVAAAAAILRFLGYNGRPKSTTSKPTTGPAAIDTKTDGPPNILPDKIAVRLACPHRDGLSSLFDDMADVHTNPTTTTNRFSICRSDMLSARVAWLTATALLPDSFRATWKAELSFAAIVDPRSNLPWYGILSRVAGLSAEQLQTCFDKKIDPCVILQSFTIRPSHEFWIDRCGRPDCTTIDCIAYAVCGGCYRIAYCSAACMQMHRPVHSIDDCPRRLAAGKRQNAAEQVYRSTAEFLRKTAVPTSDIKTPPPIVTDSYDWLAGTRQFTTYASLPSIFLHRFYLADVGLRPIENVLRSILETGDIHTIASQQIRKQQTTVPTEPDNKTDEPYNPYTGTIGAFVASIGRLKSTTAAELAAKPTDITNESWFVEFLEIQATRAFFRSNFVDHQHRFERCPDQSVVGTHRIDISCRTGPPTMMPPATIIKTMTTDIQQQNYDELLRRLTAPPDPVQPFIKPMVSDVHRFPLDPMQFDRQAFCVRCGMNGGGGRESLPACPTCGIRNACLACWRVVHAEPVCLVVFDLIRRGILRTRYRFMPDCC